jgi:hypothetical protein
MTNLEVYDLEIGESGVLHVPSLQVVGHYAERSARLLCRRSVQVVPLCNNRGIVGRSVIAVHARIHFKRLDPAARLAAAMRLSKQCWPITDAAQEITHVDEVETVGLKRPLKCSVFNFEFHIGGDPARLYGRKIGTGNLGIWVLIGEVADDALVSNTGRDGV